MGRIAFSLTLPPVVAPSTPWYDSILNLVGNDATLIASKWHVRQFQNSEQRQMYTFHTFGTPSCRRMSLSNRARSILMYYCVWIFPIQSIHVAILTLLYKYGVEIFAVIYCVSKIHLKIHEMQGFIMSS